MLESIHYQDMINSILSNTQQIPQSRLLRFGFQPDIIKMTEEKSPASAKFETAVPKIRKRVH